MIDLGILEKIRELKAKIQNFHPDAQAQVDDWQKRIEQLSEVDNFVNLPTTQEIIRVIKNRMAEHMKAKAFGRKLTLEQIRSSEDKWDELKWALSVIKPDYESEIEQIMTSVMNELQG